MFTNLAVTPRLDNDPYRTFASEAWQMGLYGSGGHYLPHFDAFDVLPGDGQAENYWVGNRSIKCKDYDQTRPGVDKVKPKGWFKYSLQID